MAYWLIFSNIQYLHYAGVPHPILHIALIPTDIRYFVPADILYFTDISIFIFWGTIFSLADIQYFITCWYPIFSSVKCHLTDI